MKIVLPRVIYGNRGDIASRWGLLNGFNALGQHDVSVFTNFMEDVPTTFMNKSFPYGRLHNFFPVGKGLKAILNANAIVWSVGLDISDDSSLLKLFYLNGIFFQYKSFGKRVICAFQGAGPINTRIGRLLTQRILKKIDFFIARDPGTRNLLSDISPSYQENIHLGHDAIFFPGIESGFTPKDGKYKEVKNQLFNDKNTPIIGFNIRQWFHFNSNFIPYQFAKKKYRQRAQDKMDILLDNSRKLLKHLRETYRAKILLISAYQPGVLEWEDDLIWLRMIKDYFAEDENILLVDFPISMPAYFSLMSKLDLSIGMRLHSTLVALRLGVPSINLSYTLKGMDILSHLGLGNYAIMIDEFLKNPEIIHDQIDYILNNKASIKTHISKLVGVAIKSNVQLLESLF